MTDTLNLLKGILEKPDYVHFVGMVMPPRPGVRLCFTKLEYTYFIPGTPRNQKFHFSALKWKEIIWAIASIPVKDAHLMEKVASETGLRITRNHLITADGEEFFSLGTGRIFHLENIKEHPVYRSTPSEIQHFLEEETEEIEKIEKIEVSWQIGKEAKVWH